MNARYSHYMNAIQPSPDFCRMLEREMNLELRRKNRRSKGAHRICIAAAVAAVMLVTFGAALRLHVPRGQVIDAQKPLSGNPTVAPAVPTMSPSGILGLEMLDETVVQPKTDVNYCYLSVPLFNQTVTVYNEDLSDSHVLQPGNVYWPVSTEKTAPADGLEYIHWWNEAANAMQEGWAEKPVESESAGSCEALGFPGKVSAGGTTLRYGPSHEAPDIIALAEGQYLHLYFRKGNWIYASTAPFDQEIETGIPNAGWVYVGDIRGLAYADENEVPPPNSSALSDDAFDYPDDNTSLDLGMSGEGAFVNGIFENAVAMFEGTLVGVDDSAPVEIHATADVGSQVLETIYPGDAYWSNVGEKQVISIADEAGNSIGYAQPVLYYNEMTDALEEGWIHKIHGEVLEEVENNPVEDVLVLGKVRGDRVPLRNGRSADAPAVAVLEKGTYLGLLYRNGNWMFAMTDPVHPRSEKTLTGWIHVTEVVGLQQRTPIDQVDLLADSVNLRNAPDGEVIETIARSDIEAGQTRIRYLMATLPGKKGNWHYVSLEKVFSFQEEIITGYIFEDLAALNTIELREELPMEGIVSATLRYEATQRYPASEQTIEGDKLNALVNRMGAAMSESVYTDLCAGGIGTLTFTYSDGHAETVSIAGDQCTNLQYNDVTYDYKTAEERQERFLNDGGVSAIEILPRYFDNVQMPWQ